MVASMGLLSCSQLGYYAHLGTGQLSILLNRVPLEQAARDKKLPEEHRRKLALIPHVRDFGTEVMGLRGGDTYQAFVQLDRSYANLVLSAAEPDALKPYRWRYPIVGAMSYRGYFSEKRAQADYDSLANQGYDVYLRPASAFSTLGWFDDPVLSPMLSMSEARLVDTVLHEMTHVTLFFPGQTSFNETVATFVGNQGAIKYLSLRHGARSGQVQDAIHAMEDNQRFALFIQELLDGLRAIYAEPIERDEKIARKESYLAEQKQRFADEVVHSFHRPHVYERFPDREWNNASLLARNAYYGDLDLFTRLYAARGESLADFIRYLATWQGEADPRARLVREIDENELIGRTKD